ncbi:MAG: ATP-binding protein [Solirubrobacterales bacterium]
MSKNVESMEQVALSLDLDARAENLLLVRQAVEGAVRASGAEGQVVDDIKLAVTEACSNVVKYAYRGDAGPLSVQVGFPDGRIAVVITDQGSWDGDSEEEGPSGMGIPIMQSVTRTHDVTTDAEGTRVTLVFEKAASDE